MTHLLTAAEALANVGVNRHPTLHYGRADTATEEVSILHSQKCLDSGIDLRDCRFSTALDSGIDERDWFEHMDQPIALEVWGSQLVPLPVARGGKAESARRRQRYAKRS